MTQAELATLLARNPQLSICRHDPNPAGPRLQDPKPQPHQRSTLEPVPKGTGSSLGRVSLCIVAYCIRPIDPDNLAGGCKSLIDGLRHAGLLYDDSPEAITLTFEQEKVSRRRDERTEILITLP